jgi:hypothetical protein
MKDIFLFLLIFSFFISKNRAQWYFDLDLGDGEVAEFVRVHSGYCCNARYGRPAKYATKTEVRVVLVLSIRFYFSLLYMCVGGEGVS